MTLPKNIRKHPNKTDQRCILTRTKTNTKCLIQNDAYNVQTSCNNRRLRGQPQRKVRIEGGPTLSNYNLCCFVPTKALADPKPTFWCQQFEWCKSFDSFNLEMRDRVPVFKFIVLFNSYSMASTDNIQTIMLPTDCVVGREVMHNNHFFLLHVSSYG